MLSPVRCWHSAADFFGNGKGLQKRSGHCKRLRPQSVRPDGSERLRRRIRGEGVFDCVEMIYNPNRRHVRNAMLPPTGFERQHMTRTGDVRTTCGYSDFRFVCFR